MLYRLVIMGLLYSTGATYIIMMALVNEGNTLYRQRPVIALANALRVAPVPGLFFVEF